MTLKGDFAGLGKLEANLRRLSEVPSQAAREAATSIQALIEQEYATGKDSTGRPWAPLRPATLAKGRTPPPLTATRAMRETTEVKPMAGAGVSVTFEEDYASYHHTGTKNMVARPVAPTGAFPKAWGDAIDSAVQNAMSRRLGSR